MNNSPPVPRHHRWIRFICRQSVRHPVIWLGSGLFLVLLALTQLGKLGLDTDLIRLLPDSHSAVKMKRQMSRLHSGTGGSFVILIHGSDSDKLKETFFQTLDRLGEMDNISFLEYKNPVEFYKTYRYRLLPTSVLNRFLDSLIRMESEINPMTLDLLGDEEDPGDDDSQNDEEKSLMKELNRYLNLPPYHQNEQGTTMGIRVFPKKGITSLGKMKRILSELEALTGNISEERGIWIGVSGSIRNNIDQYNFIVSDLSRSGLITIICILLILIIGFRGVRAIPVVLIPLTMGMLWTLGIIPTLVGDLNTITAFLILVSFGLGVDFSIHLVKRFIAEISRSPIDNALFMTFSQTGGAITISGITTAVTLLLLIFSQFRGFSEFGLVGGISLLFILINVILFLPSVCVLAVKIRLLKPRSTGKSFALHPSLWITVLILILLGVSIFFVYSKLTFNYDFSDMEVQLPRTDITKERYYEVYQSLRSPAAIIVAENLTALDRLLLSLDSLSKKPGSRISRFHSIRDLIPDENGIRTRREIMEEIKSTIHKKWVDKIEDPEYKEWIHDFKDWNPPDKTLETHLIPQSIRNQYVTNLIPDHFLVPVFIRGEKQKGKNAIAFTEEIKDLAKQDGILGPSGETTILADVLLIVTREGPRFLVLSFLCILVLIWIAQKSFTDALWILIPLASGMVMTAGIMVMAGLSLNFFNMVVFPTLVGMGVDDGVHYFRRWRELKQEIGPVQQELFNPLTVTSATTISSYLGISLSAHPGLQSIGILASIGLFCTWLTTLFLLPHLLKWFYRGKTS